MADTKMDAIALLKEDHKNVKQLFRDYEGLGDRAMQRRQGLYKKISTELEIHTMIEEEIFYPAAREVTDEMVAEAMEEHQIVKRLLQELEGMDPSDERFDAKMTVVIENVEHHADEEEQEMFPEVKKKIDTAQLSQLGAKMMERKQQLMRQLSAAA
jgi:hemerythrin superfamily protein